MLERLIIINWKFYGNHQMEWEIVGTPNCKVICLNVQDTNTFINQINIYQSKQTLILLHKNTPNSNVTLNGVLLPNNLGTVKKPPRFGDGIDKVYLTDNNNLGLLFANGQKIDNDAKEESNGVYFIKKDNFEFVWDYYWNKLDLEYQKKNIINLWLPLAIDIQGLSEVQNDGNKAEQYFDEIKKETDYLNSLKSFPKDEEFPRWEEIRIELNKGYKDFYPVDLVNEILTKKDFSYFDKKYFSDPKFLPNWLQEVVRVIDEKLKQNS